MSHNDDLHQQLYEFIYGLLDEDASRRMQQRITSEPDVARAYSEVKQQTELLAKAAQLHQPPVALSKPENGSSQSKARASRKSEREPSSSPPAANPLQWLVALAALALLCLTGWHYFQPASPIRQQSAQQHEQQVADEHVRMIVTGPARFHEGAPGTFTVNTTTVDGRDLPAKVQFALYAPATGELLLDGESPEDRAEGRFQLSIPPGKLQHNARLEVRAQRGANAVQMTTHLQVEKARYATQITTDKPLYRPGETLRYRSLTLTRFGLASERELPVHFKILGPGDGVVPGSEQTGLTQRGVASGEFPIAPHLAGGQYTLVVSSSDAEPAFPEERREFFVRQYRLPRLKKELEFTRDSYAPGDTVTADFLAERAEGGAAAGAQLTIHATVDGEAVFSNTPKAGPDGSFRVEFQLPAEIDKGAGTLAVVVDDGGSRETIAKTIPINLGKVEVQFYPEGGDLVAGLENRVYFFAHDPLGEPIDIKTGRIVDGQGREVARLSTYHEGRGVLRFTPAAEEAYRLEITDPPGVTIKGALPKVSSEQTIVMNTGSGVFAAGQPIELDILSTKAGLPLVIAAVCRGSEIETREFVTQQASSVNAEDRSKTRVSLPLLSGLGGKFAAGGVIRLTVYDYSSKPPRPVAERLVYRRPAQRLNVQLAETSEAYTPGQPVKLALTVTDERGVPQAAALGVSVVDDALLNLADDKSPEMSTYFLLATEIENPQDLEDANFYLLEGKQKDKDPAKALDLLLGTQGWRRFAQVKDAGLLADAPATAAHQDDAEAAVRDEAVDRLVAMEGVSQRPLLYDNLREAESQYESSLDDFYRRRETAIQWVGQISFFGGAALLVVLVLMGIMRVGRDARFWLPATAAAAVCVVAGGLWMGAKVDQQGELALVPFVLFDESASMVAQADMDAETTTGPEDPGATRGHEVFEGNDPAELAAPLAEELPEGDDQAANFEPPAPAAPKPADDADFAPADQPFADNDIGRAPAGLDDLLAEPEAGERPGTLPLHRFDVLGDVGKYLQNELSAANRTGTGYFMYAENGRSLDIYFDGTINDVERMRKLWRQQLAHGSDEAALAFGDAYRKLLARYQLPVRQYAHKHIKGEPGVRSDFTETLYWNPLLIADSGGQAVVEFELSDSVTTFRLRADAHGAGRIGTGGGEIVSRIPFSLEPKLPLEVNAGDRIELPLAVNNDTREKLPVKVVFHQQGELLELTGDAERQLVLPASQRSREFFELAVVGQSGVAELQFDGLAGHLSDRIAKSIKVVPPGFPVSESYSGQLAGDQKLTVKLPEGWVEGSLQVSLQAFPSTLADIQKGMEGMLRDPNGCFEQTSSSNYPNVLALAYMEEHDVANPAFTRRAKDLLERGYGKLISFECKEADDRKGFEWFGQWPAHEALTAYGLMQFRDMAEVWDVDQEMIQRTADWLMKQRDGKGGFKRNPRALDSFGGAPPEITNAYIVWALTEANQQGIDKELDHVIDVAGKSDDAYIVALAAASADSTGRKADSQKLMKKLAGLQQDDGHLAAKETTITRSGGISLKIETTALAALAWLKDPAMAAQANKAVEWIVANRQGGSFGSTQATILALKALIEHSKANRKTVTSGELIVMRDGEEIGRQQFGAGESDPIELGPLAAQLVPGENELTIALTGDNQMPYALDVSYRTRQPVSHEECPLRLATKLSAEKVAAGEVVQLNVGLENISDKGQPMSIAIVGLPAGLEPRKEHLEELKEQGKFDYYELQARELVFYWRSLSPAAKGDGAIGFDVDLVAEIPGQYTGPASRSYLYYTAEQKHWVEPLSAEITRE